jgi:hypothetical protein
VAPIPVIESEASKEAGMSKPKMFRPGRHAEDVYLKIKAGSVRIKDETGSHGIPTLDVTVRLTERNCENLQRQVESFLRALKKRRSSA